MIWHLKLKKKKIEDLYLTQENALLVKSLKNPGEILKPSFSKNNVYIIISKEIKLEISFVNS